MSKHKAYYEQAPLFILPPSISQPRVYDPYWDEITKKTAPDDTGDRWNPADFAETPFKSDNEQLTIFYNDSHEPPEPDDFNNIEEFEKAWSKWESVREQATYITREQSAPEHICNNSSNVTSTTSQLLTTGVREQTRQSLQAAPEHIDISSNEVAQITNSLSTTGVREQLQLVNSPNEYTSVDKPKQQQKVNQWVEIYWVKTGNKKHEYYRYCWMEGRRISRVHIGSTANSKAVMRAELVKDAILKGSCPSQIKQLIKENF